jgi:hypothetical protein
MTRLLRRLWLKRQLDKSLRARRIVREARAEAARRGISAEWRKRGDQARRMFGENA